MGRISQNQREQDNAARISEQRHCHIVNCHSPRQLPSTSYVPCVHWAMGVTRFPGFFSGKGERIECDIRNVYPAITRQFASLVNKPQLDDVDAAMDQLERFVVLLYNKLCTTSYVNVVRFDLFARKGRDVNDIPPTKGAFLQHARRATY